MWGQWELLSSGGTLLVVALSCCGIIICLKFDRDLLSKYPCAEDATGKVSEWLSYVPAWL